MGRAPYSMNQILTNSKCWQVDMMNSNTITTLDKKPPHCADWICFDAKGKTWKRKFSSEERNTRGKKTKPKKEGTILIVKFVRYGRHGSVFRIARAEKSQKNYELHILLFRFAIKSKKYLTFQCMKVDSDSVPSSIASP